MTVIYSGDLYHLSEESVTISTPGQTPRTIDVASLPLPVARALQSWRTSAARI